jgi:putative hemolysin
MALKLTPGRFAERFRGSPMFPALMFPVFPALMLRPNSRSALLPFVGGWRPKPRRLGGWQQPKVYGRIGSLEVRLARKKSEIRQAQRLRYKVFYEEMSATPGALAILSRRDEDAFDKVFDHLLVVDRGDQTNGRRWRRSHVVGTYRVLRQEVADRYAGFYTQGEYDIEPLIRTKGAGYRFMELGRSCVLKPYRNKRTLELLWQGVWSYVREHGVDVMVGCASFEGTDPSAHAMALSFLYHHALAPEGWRVRAHDHLRVDMNMLPAEAVNARAALKSLPPLIKGYLRLGAYIGDGAVIDHQFGTTDVLVILPVEAIKTRYFAHFGSPDALCAPIAAPEFAALN